jgi:cell division initiation protein
MKVTPLDLRQTRFRKALRGYNAEEVRALLSDAADDYETALRDLDGLRQDLQKGEVQLAEHREREANLRNTLVTAQRVADQMRDNAGKEADVLLRDAETRAAGALKDAELRSEATLRDAAAKAEALVRDAQARVELMLQKAHVRLDELDSAVAEMRLRKRDSEATLEQSIASLTYALEFVRTQDARDEKVRLHRPRLIEGTASIDTARGQSEFEARLG